MTAIIEDFSAQGQADYYRKRASYYYRRARRELRNADQWQEAADGCRRHSEWWLTHTDDPEHEKQSRNWAEQAETWARIAQRARDRVPGHRKEARRYRGLQRSYEAMAAEDAAALKELEEAYSGR
jgi:hypothetical protein